jgi:hypothetical protein
MDVRSRDVHVGIADWELPFDSAPTPLAYEAELEEELWVYPPGAQALLDLLAPYLPPVTEAVRPLLEAHGLSGQEATLEGLLAVEGLAEAVLDAARAAVARIDAVGLEPFNYRGYEAPVGALPMGWALERTDGDEAIASLTASEPPDAGLLRPLPAGWDVPPAEGPRHLAYGEDGEPCYPDVPAFEEFWPKCPQSEMDAPLSATLCTDDARFVRAEQRLQSLRHFERVPSSFRGFDYRVELKRSVSLPTEEVYRCGERPSSLYTLASWVGPPGPGVVRLYERFFDLELEWDVLSVLSGPVDFRAAVLLHEHVHRIEDPQQGAVSAPPERSYQPAGSVGQQDCPWSGTEYDAAYVQALYLGSGEALARVVANIYGRAQCTQLSRTTQVLAAANDLIEALGMGWLAALEVVVTLTAGIMGDEGLDWLPALLAHDIAALMLIGLPR